MTKAPKGSSSLQHVWREASKAESVGKSFDALRAGCARDRSELKQLLSFLFMTPSRHQMKDSTVTGTGNGASPENGPLVIAGAMRMNDRSLRAEAK